MCRFRGGALLLWAGLAVALAGAAARPAAAHPHDHPCSRMVDTNCYIDFGEIRHSCDLYLELPGQFRCHSPLHK